MGTPVPSEFPDYDDVKYYCITFHVFESDGAPDECDGAFITACKVCMSGADIKLFYGTGEECKDNRHPCDPGLWGNHRLICATGPFDTLDDCNDHCPRLNNG